jgi:hypothetical protein
MVALGSYARAKQLRGPGAIYAVSVSTGNFISATTKKENGKVFIKMENISPDDLVVVCHTGDYFAVHFHQVDEYIVSGTAWPITKKQAQGLQFRKEEALA